MLSCMTERKRADIFHGYAARHRADVLAYCPPVKELPAVKGKPDTVTVIDTVNVKVPYPVPGTNDTIWVECPETEAVYRYIRQTDTVYRENTSELELLALELKESEEGKAVSDALMERSENRAKNLLWSVIGLAVALAASIALRFFKII